MRKRLLLGSAIMILALLVGCTKQPTASDDQGSSAGPGGTTTAQGGGSGASQQKAPGLLERLTSKPVTLPAGTVLTVRLGQQIGSKENNAGDSFAATVAEPVDVEGKTVIPSGAEATGTVIEAVPRGKFKGAAKLKIALTSVRVNGSNYDIQTESYARASKGKGKRTAAMIGGGAGAGAIIGAIAGGGKGAAIGALVGGGGGTAGAYFTGNNKDVVLPAESAISFRLTQPVEIKQ